MAVNFSKVSNSVWQILKGRGNKLKIYDETGQPTLSPEDARRMYLEDEGIMVSINEMGDDSEIKIYLSSQNDLSEIKSLLQSLRQTANFYAVNYNVRKYGKELLPRQFKFLTHKVNRDKELAESLNYKNKDVKFRFPAGFKNDLQGIIDKPKSYAGLIKMRDGVYVVQLSKVNRSEKGMITRKTNKGEWIRFKDFANGTIRTYIDSKLVQQIEQEPEVLDEFSTWVENFSIGDTPLEEEAVHDEGVVDDEDLSTELLSDPTLKGKIMDDPTVINKYIEKDSDEEQIEADPRQKPRREFTKK